jgi:hypothetical protein
MFKLPGSDGGKFEGSCAFNGKTYKFGVVTFECTRAKGWHYVKHSCTDVDPAQQAEKEMACDAKNDVKLTFHDGGAKISNNYNLPAALDLGEELEEDCGGTLRGKVTFKCHEDGEWKHEKSACKGESEDVLTPLCPSTLFVHAGQEGRSELSQMGEKLDGKTESKVCGWDSSKPAGQQRLKIYFRCKGGKWESDLSRNTCPGDVFASSCWQADFKYNGKQFKLEHGKAGAVLEKVCPRGNLQFRCVKKEWKLTSNTCSDALCPAVTMTLHFPFGPVPLKLPAADAGPIDPIDCGEGHSGTISFACEDNGGTGTWVRKSGMCTKNS